MNSIPNALLTNVYILKSLTLKAILWYTTFQVLLFIPCILKNRYNKNNSASGFTYVCILESFGKTLKQTNKQNQ